MSKKVFSESIEGGTPPLYKNLIDGRWVGSATSPLIDRISPVDQSIIGRIPVCGESEVQQAFASAKKAQPAWASLPRTQRATILHRWANILREHVSVLVELIIMDIGKNHTEAKDEVLRSADMIDAFAHTALTIQGEYLTGDGFVGYDQSKTALVEPVPLGIVVAIPPFNYPINLSVAKIAPALVMGNAVVIKPPVQGSLACLAMIACLHDAGLPAGVLSSITGKGKEVGTLVVCHPDVNMIAFTGSSPVGHTIARQVSMIPLLFECGGNNAALVLPDADIDHAAKEIVKGSFSYSGQRCTALNYIIGLPKTMNELLPKVSELIQKTIVMGDPRKKEVTFGPLISEQEAIDVEKRIQEAVKEGATIAIGGKRKGYFIEPTVLSDVTPTMDIVKHELFGPVVSFIRVQSVEEMIAIVNQSSYGLQSSVFTQDEGTGIAIGKRLQVGGVQINSRPMRGPDHFPFFGMKESGIGVQGISYTLRMMTRPHAIFLTNPQ